MSWRICIPAETVSRVQVKTPAPAMRRARLRHVQLKKTSGSFCGGSSSGKLPCRSERQPVPKDCLACREVQRVGRLPCDRQVGRDAPQLKSRRQHREVIAGAEEHDKQLNPSAPPDTRRGQRRLDRQRDLPKQDSGRCFKRAGQGSSGTSRGMCRGTAQAENPVAF